MWWMDAASADEWRAVINAGAGHPVGGLVYYADAAQWVSHLAAAKVRGRAAARPQGGYRRRRSWAGLPRMSTPASAAIPAGDGVLLLRAGWNLWYGRGRGFPAVPQASCGWRDS